MVSKHARRGFGFLLFLVLTATMGFAEGAQELPVSRAKNVILLIADGCAAGTYTLGRWYKGAPLATDAIYTGAVKTHNFDSVIPDSAAAASTYATGVRTYRGGLECRSDGEWFVHLSVDTQGDAVSAHGYGFRGG